MNTLLERYPALTVCAETIQKAYETLKHCFANKGKLLICGNGGSAADAEHMVGELMKGFLLKRPLTPAQHAQFTTHYPHVGAYLADHLQYGLPAIALSGHPALATAFANDVSADMLFAQQVFVYGQPQDVVLGISTSGNSKNVLHALQVAKVNGLKTIGLSGGAAGQMRSLCETLICVPAHQTAHVQELHLPIYHTLCSMLEANFFEA